MEQQQANGTAPQQPVQQEASAPQPITAYCMKTKEKNVPVQDAVISRTSRGGYMVQGHDGNGNKMTTMLSSDNAKAAIAAGLAKKSEDWVD